MQGSGGCQTTPPSAAVRPIAVRAAAADADRAARTAEAFQTWPPPRPTDTVPSAPVPGAGRAVTPRLTPGGGAEPPVSYRRWSLPLTYQRGRGRGGAVGLALTEEKRLEAEGAHDVGPAGHQLHSLRVAHLRGELR